MLKTITTQENREYTEIASIRDADNILIIPITSHDQPNGFKRIACSFQREYTTKDGEIHRTYWLQRSHLLKMRTLLDDVIDRMDEEEEKSRLEACRRKKREEVVAVEK
jgi:hypothetical protein